MSETVDEGVREIHGWEKQLMGGAMNDCERDAERDKIRGCEGNMKQIERGRERERVRYSEGQRVRYPDRETMRPVKEITCNR